MPPRKATNGKANGKAHDDSAQRVIAFDDAVTEGRKLLTEIKQKTEASDWRLGELADTIERRYGEKTLAKFAAEIGVGKCIIERRRSVWRAWKNISEPAPKSFPFGIATALQADPKRAAPFILENPGMTRAEARKLAKELKPDSSEAAPAKTDTAEAQSGRIATSKKVSATKGVSTHGQAIVRANEAAGMAQDLRRWLDNDPDAKIPDLLVERCAETAKEWAEVANFCAQRRQQTSPQGTLPEPDDAPALSEDHLESESVH